MRRKYEVQLTAKERTLLQDMTRKGTAAAYKIKHAHILLKADRGGAAWGDEHIAEAYAIHANTVAAVRRRYAAHGLEAAVNRKHREEPGQKPIFDGEKEARLLALSCGEPPQGRARWTLHLLADKVVELKIVDSVSHETVRKALKKTSSSRICAGRG